MSILFPEASPVLGNTKVIICDTVANRAAPDLSAEINAGTSLDISCFIAGWMPDEQANSGTQRPRLCTTTTLPAEGRTAIQPIELEYIYDPQAATSTDDNKARLKLAQFSIFTAVVRKGTPFTVAAAVADFTETIKFRCGRQRYVPSGDDDQAEFIIRQTLYPLDERVHGQVVA